MRSTPELPARSVLKVCRLRVEAAADSTAGVTGAALQQRIVRPAAKGSYARVSPGRRLLVAALALFVLGLPLTAGLLNSRQLHAQSSQHLPSFEVASIRPDPDVRGMSMGSTGSTWYDRGGTALLLVMSAFELKQFQILNAPGWLNSEKYTIEARLPDDVMQLPEEERWKQIGPMLQSLLGDRFHLRYHWIDKVHPVYSLIVDKGGPRLNKARPEEKGSLTIGPGYFEGQAIPMDQLAENLGGNLDAIVQNRTGLVGNYNLALHYARPDSDGTPSPADELSNLDAQSRLFSALQDQLGLKLVAEKRPVRMLVIDGIDRPTPN